MRRLRELDSAIIFVAVAAGLTLISALALVSSKPAIEPNAGSFLRASFIYVAVIGWQPLVALAIVRRFIARDERPFDEGIHPVSFRDSMFSVGIAMFVLSVAVVVETSLNRGSTRPQLDVQLSWFSFVQAVFALVAVISLLWLQALIEEVTWRGYILPRLMSALGVWPGLIAHGVLWGLCHAPLFAMSGSGVEQSLAFVVTCTLLGVLLGWLRLSTRSVFASAAANATLTICAGLPFVVIGERSHFSAAFEPSGWVPLAGVIIIILGHRPWRRSITIPYRRMPSHLN